MERMLTAFWDEDRQELEVRRPTGQVFRFSARQAVAGGHEVFGGQVIYNEIWVLTGAAGSRRPTWKARYTQTGSYHPRKASCRYTSPYRERVCDTLGVILRFHQRRTAFILAAISVSPTP